MTGGVAALAHDLASSLDPATTMRRAFAVTPEDWQADLLRSGDRRVLLLCCRQSGKSLTTAAMALHRVLYAPGSLVVCIAPTQRQSSEWFLKLRHGFRALGRPVKVIAENESEMRLGNGSRLVALPGTWPVFPWLDPARSRGASTPCCAWLHLV